MAGVLSSSAASFLLQSLGAVALGITGYRCLAAASVWLLPALPLSRYQRPGQLRSWALVTGASAGIGYSCAQELAARGFNVVLHGHKPAELDQAKDAIESESPDAQVQVLVLDAVKASADDIAEAIKSISHLPITVLVNNVGGITLTREAGILRMHEYRADEVDSTLNLNARFMIHVSRLLTPVLASNGPSLMLNISSAAKMGIPFVAPYSACKGFIVSLSKALQREVRSAGMPVDVLCIIPGDVESQANKISLTPGTPTSRRYARCVMDRCGRAIARGWTEIAPWWPHALQIGLMEYMPEGLLQKALVQTFEQKKKDYEAYYKSK
ncbi:hypothetical protein ACJ41O_012469 [Fusarium nematophilum]